MACPRYYEQNRILNLHFHREISVVIIHDRGVFCSFYATVPGYFIKEPFLSVSPAIDTAQLILFDPSMSERITFTLNAENIEVEAKYLNE
jgi:hypothetical protein